MSRLYQCIICQYINTSTMNLHNHHVQHHSPVELSETIINLQGFKILNNVNNTEKRYLKPIKVGDNNNNIHNNNENLYNRVIIKTEENKKFLHDKASCLLKCGQFIPWEHELNKRKEINDEEFVNIIEQLCYDLSKRKQRGRKRKSEIDSTEIKSPVKDIQNENIMGTSNKIMNNSDIVPSQISTATVSSWNAKSSTNMADDSILKLEIDEKEVDTENNDSMTLELHNIDTNKDVLIYDPSTGKFSWSSIMSGISFENKASTS
ncbi:putative uncharacterized protein DDB_G0274405 [Osmia bicornis bicornis]|uniref:putative uncharacterized protein DDB_G0274405 n=1 Tax=Osmia bicornis bicornis TaxID=1437191 RepID=UPI001EAF2F83|nr:putative uncharacterized protein DDB_G0274405 [Osmia bicornis bicornis]